MSELLTSLANAVASGGNGDDDVALLLSGGLDSLSVGLALQKVGRKVHAYTFYLQDAPSTDLKRAMRIAAHYEWPHTGVEIPTANIADDFIRLAAHDRCQSKVHFEVMWPMSYLFAAIEERQVYTGWNADFYYGNGKEDCFRRRRLVSQRISREERKAIFDAERRQVLDQKLLKPSNESWWYAHRMAQGLGKTLHAPYLDSGVRDFFLTFDQDQLSSPNKPVVRQQLANELERLPKNGLGPRLPLQIGGGVSSLFETLLKNKRINRFEPTYSAVSPLCQRWGREVEKDPNSYVAEAAALGPRPAARTTLYASSAYRPYKMARRLSGSRRSRAISLFAGGGGTCIGLQLAGFNVVLANEFVQEAARTYRENFPDTVMDTRDIRKITESRATVQEFLRSVGMAPGDPDVVSGSFPCSEFSVLGSGISDPRAERAYSDTVQRDIAGLMFDFMLFNRAALPKVVISENVPPLATTYGPLLEAALDHLRFTSEGGQRLYYVAYRVLSADDYGVPQSRRRVLIVAVRSDVAQVVGLQSDADIFRLLPSPISAPVSIREAFKGLYQTAEHVRPWREAMLSSSLHGIVCQLPGNPRTTMRPRDIGLGSESRFTLARPPWDSPCPTLTVMGQRPDGLSGVIHPEEDRKFTIPELKRLTGLPDDYALTGTLAQGAERICRMVPPLMIKAVADRVRELVLGPYREASNG